MIFSKVTRLRLTGAPSLFPRFLNHEVVLVSVQILPRPPVRRDFTEVHLHFAIVGLQFVDIASQVESGVLDLRDCQNDLVVIADRLFEFFQLVGGPHFQPALSTGLVHDVGDQASVLFSYCLLFDRQISVRMQVL